MTGSKEFFEKLESMGVDEVRLALAEGRFRERRATLAQHWLDHLVERSDPQSLLHPLQSQIDLLNELAEDFAILLPQFVSGSFGVLFLPTELEAEFQSLLSNARASLREFLGPTHEFTFQLMRLDPSENFEGRTSKSNVHQVIAALRGAVRYLSTRPVVPSSRSTLAAMPFDQLLEHVSEEERRFALKKMNHRDNDEIISENRKVFLVHGHDHGTRDQVARFLESLDFELIILEDQPNRNRTIIEKFEGHSDVTFAVVLLTPDDEGRSNRNKASGIEAVARARQNVILELGYFIGKLGRNRVCALAKDSVEVPSDLAGVICEAIDAAGAWKNKLAKELHAADYEINWKKVSGVKD